MMIRKRFLFAASALLLGLSSSAQVHRMDIDLKKVGAPIQPTMYGIFFEDINYAADGGLYAELVKNRSFEFPNDPLQGWKAFGTVEVWNPENGSVTPLLFTTADAGVSATLDMDENAALFLVARRDGVQDKTIITPQYQESQVLDGPWKVTFQEGRGAPEEATFASLIDWTTHSDEGIRYYSGIATYTTTFYVDHPAVITLLGLGSVKNMAAVSINGTSCGTAWKAPWQVQIPDGILREGENVLTVRVANLWVNRIIGDRRQQTRFTSTPHPFYSADDALLPSGLLGPVILFQENKRIFVRK